MSMIARWSIQCDGIGWLPDYRCHSVVRGGEDETPADLHSRAITKRGWTHDIRTGKDFCKGKHLEPEGGAV